VRPYSSLVAVLLATSRSHRGVDRIANPDTGLLLPGFFRPQLCVYPDRRISCCRGHLLFFYWGIPAKARGMAKLLRKVAWLAAEFLYNLPGHKTYFIWKAGPARFFLRATVVFVSEYYPKTSRPELVQRS